MKHYTNMDCTIVKSVIVIDISIILLVILNGGENFYGGGNRDTWNKNNDKRHHIHFVSSTPHHGTEADIKTSIPRYEQIAQKDVNQTKIRSRSPYGNSLSSYFEVRVTRVVNYDSW